VSWPKSALSSSRSPAWVEQPTCCRASWHSTTRVPRAQYAVPTPARMASALWIQRPQRAPFLYHVY
jgi:hypothetical protein